jgi:hypothetical protein
MLDALAPNPLDVLTPQQLEERDRLIAEIMRTTEPVKRLEDIMGPELGPEMDEELAAFEKMRAERRARERELAR